MYTFIPLAAEGLYCGLQDSCVPSARLAGKGVSAQVTNLGLRTVPSLTSCMGCRVSLKSLIFKILLVILLVGFAWYFVNEPATFCRFRDHGDQRPRALLAPEGPSRPYEGAHHPEDLSQELHLGAESTGGEGHRAPTGSSFSFLAPAASSGQNASDESAVAVVLQVQHLAGSQSYVMSYLRSLEGAPTGRAHVLRVMAASSASRPSWRRQSPRRQPREKGKGKGTEGGKGKQAMPALAGPSLASLPKAPPPPALTQPPAATTGADAVVSEAQTKLDSLVAALGSSQSALLPGCRPTLGHTGAGGCQCREQGPPQSHQRPDCRQEGEPLQSCPWPPTSWIRTAICIPQQPAAKPWRWQTHGSATITSRPRKARTKPAPGPHDGRWLGQCYLPLPRPRPPSRETGGANTIRHRAYLDGRCRHLRRLCGAGHRSQC